MKNPTWYGSFLVFCSAVGYGCLPVFIRIAYRYTSVSANDLLLWRFLLSSLIVWAMLFARGEFEALRKLSRRQLVTVLGLGALFAGASYSAFVALHYVPATTFTVLLYTYPSLVALLSILLGQRLTLIKWLAIGLALFGTLLTVGGRVEGGSTYGIVLVLLNVAFYAFYLVLASFSGARVPGRFFAAISMTGTLFTLSPFLIVNGVSAPSEPIAWLMIAGLVTFSTVMPILAMYKGLEYIGAPAAAVVSTFEPVTTVILAGLLLAERISAVQYVGGLLILVSVLLLQIPARWLRPVMARLRPHRL